MSRQKDKKTKRQKDRKTERQKDRKTKRQKYKKTKDEDQKESLILRRQGSFALLRCFSSHFYLSSAFAFTSEGGRGPKRFGMFLKHSKRFSAMQSVPPPQVYSKIY